MKQLGTKIILTVLMSMVSVIASAYEIKVDNADGVTIYYNYINDGKDLEVTNGKSYSGNIIIPEEVTYMNRTRKVTRIGNNAFRGCSSLTSIMIPNSVISIGDYVFAYCSGLTSIIVPNSVTSIGDYAFDHCSGLTSVTIGNSVTSIGRHAFKYCSGLTSVTIPNSVTSIGNYAFAYCSGLTSIIVPNSVTSIGYEAFYKCTSLTSVTIGNSATSIGGYAFAYCNGLTSVDIPNSVTSIGDHAFDHCSGLTSVTIGNSVTSIGRGTFYGCSGLTSVTIPSSVTSIGSSAFSGWRGLTSVVSLIKEPFKIHGKSSEDRTFRSDVFNNATLYVPVGTINKYKSTEGWNDFAHIVEGTGPGGEIPDDPTPVDDPVISGSCGESANFSYDKVTHTLVISGNGAMTDYDGYGQNEAPWSTYSKEIQAIEIESGITTIGESAFNGCYGVTSINIPNSVTRIGPGAFYACSGLTSVSIGNSVTSIGSVAFMGCYSLTSFNIPNSVTSIESGVFGNCTGLTSITIPNSVTSIGNIAFFCCSSLTSITIPNSVTSIGEAAFADCSSLTSVNSLIENPFAISSDAFRYTYNNATLYVPIGTIDKYKATEGWKDFAFIEEWKGTEIPDPINPYEDSKINGTCGDNVNYIYNKTTHSLAISGSGAMTDYGFGQNEAPWFSYANEIQAIAIKSGVTTIGDFAFYKCSGVASINIPATVTSIGSSAFEECSGLTSLTLNEGLENIKGSAFESCMGLKSITLPSTINTILLNAFKNCKGVTDVYCYSEGIPNTDDAAFDSTPTETATLHVPTNAVDAYKTAWPWSDFQSIVGIGEDITEVDGVEYIVEGETAVVSMGVDIKDELKIEESVEVDGRIYLVTAIAAGAFMGNVEITSVVIPNSVEAIGERAFEGCTGINSIIIGKAVREIAYRAFASLFNDAGTRAEGKGIDVYCYAEAVPNTATDAFDGTPTEVSTLHVPASAVEAYKAAWPWSDFKEIVAIEEGPDGIMSVRQSADGGGDYYDLTGLKAQQLRKGLYIRNGKKVVIK